MLGGPAYGKILMVWGFFDESGWHAKSSGKLLKLTVGGCFATFESWECLSAEWASAITAMGISCFHMADFQARRPPYNTWTEPQREDRLNVLLGILGAKDRHCYGFTNYARPGDTTASLYERCAHDMFVELSMYDEEFSIVFAHHPEFGRYAALLDPMLKYGAAKTIRSVTVALPVDTCPLQAADIIAYEIRCQEREELIPMRYPLRRLQELGATFRLVSAAE
jgi:hypothetical protein